MEKVVNPDETVIAISHCNCPERAEDMKKMVQEQMKVKDIIVLDTAGISSMYAADGGVILVV